MFLERRPKSPGCWRVRQVEIRVPLGVDPHRADTCKDQARDDRFMCVSSDQQLLVRPGDGEHRSLHRQRTSTGGKERVIGTHSVGHQLFCPLQDSLGHGPVVQTGQRQHIRTEKSVPQNSPNPWVGSRPCLWPGGVKDSCSCAWYAVRASSTGAVEWSMMCGFPVGAGENTSAELPGRRTEAPGDSPRGRRGGASPRPPAAPSGMRPGPARILAPCLVAPVREQG